MRSTAPKLVSSNNSKLSAPVPGAKLELDNCDPTVTELGTDPFVVSIPPISENIAPPPASMSPTNSSAFATGTIVPAKFVEVTDPDSTMLN